MQLLAASQTRAPRTRIGLRRPSPPERRSLAGIFRRHQEAGRSSRSLLALMLQTITPRGPSRS
jgi:hypothetical protein